VKRLSVSWVSWADWELAGVQLQWVCRSH